MAVVPRKTYRVSIKGVIPCGGRILLLRKPNGLWDLPGGRLEDGEAVADCLAREVFEETGLHTRPTRAVASWVRRRKPSKDDVFISAYLCAEIAGLDEVILSDEHIGAGLFDADAIAELGMDPPCREAVLTVFEALA